MTTDTTYETDAEADTGHLHDGPRITPDELAVHLSAIELRLRQLARAAETPATPVELEQLITTLRHSAADLRRAGTDAAFLARVAADDVPLATTFPSGDPWGAAARDTTRTLYGGPAIIPTVRQIIHLAQIATDDTSSATTTWSTAMTGVGHGWESKTAQTRRRHERDTAVRHEVLTLPCERCQAESGQPCRTTSGWEAAQPHTARQREAEARVDARLGYLDTNPVAVPDA